MSTMLEARGLEKVFQGGDGGTIEVLQGVDLAVARGESVAIIGESGAGKSTLLHMLGALEAPTAGEVWLDGVAYGSLSDKARDELRNHSIGFVFQFHHLLRDFSAAENVMMPLLIGGTDPVTAHERAGDLLRRVGLGERLTHRPTQLSGGEQQRCAVARALVHRPQVLLADEPSGNLDQAHSTALHDLLLDLVREMEMTLVVVTHNRQLARRAHRILQLENGVFGAEALSEVVT